MTRRRASRIAIALAMSCAVVGVAHAQDGSPYEQLRKALFAGSSVTAIFTPSQCEASEATGATSSISGGFEIRDFVEVSGRNLGFSNRHLTLRPDGTAVLEIAQYRAMPDNTVGVTVTMLSPLTYRALDAPRTFRCRFDRGLSFVVRPDRAAARIAASTEAVDSGEFECSRRHVACH